MHEYIEHTPRVREYMTRTVEFVTADVTIKEAIDKLMSTPYPGLPVVTDANSRKVIGFITAKELLRYAYQPDKKLKEIVKSTFSVTPDISLDDTARILFRHGLRNIPVIDDNGILIGIISNIDIIRSHIERVTPNKVLFVKNFLEKRYSVKITITKRVILISDLRPTQPKIYADELEGRINEIQRGLAEPLIVLRRPDYYILIDGHHRALAAKKLGLQQFQAYILEMDKESELGLEKHAKELGIYTLNDVKIDQTSHHPLVEITTRLIERLTM